jgi:hypothetical protein
MQNMPSMRHLEVGDTYTFSNFISTSTSRYIAELYANSPVRGRNTEKCVFVFDKLVNIPYLYMPNDNMTDLFTHKTNTLSALIREQPIENDFFEYVLPRNLKFKITKITTKTSNLVLPYIHNYSDVITELEQAQAQAHGAAASIENVENATLEHAIYGTTVFYYCTFIERVPVKPMKFSDFKNIEIFLDRDSLASWETPKNQK